MAQEIPRQKYYKSPNETVKGFVVIEHLDGDRVRIAENWTEKKYNLDAGWRAYTVQADEIRSRINNGAEYVGDLSSDQFMRICQAAEGE